MQAFAWKLTIDKKPVFLDLSHRNTINDNEVLCVGCVLTANILGTCSMNAIFFSRVWFDHFRWWGGLSEVLDTCKAVSVVVVVD